MLHWPSVAFPAVVFLIATASKRLFTTYHGLYTPYTTHRARHSPARTTLDVNLTTVPVAMGLDVDAYPEAPQELELQQVHVYIRHGQYHLLVRIRIHAAQANARPYLRA